MLNGDGNENGKKKSIGLLSKKTILYAAHFSVHLFAVIVAT